MSYTVTANFTVDVTDPSAVSAIAATTGVPAGDELAQVQAMANVGLHELESIARRYGLSVSNSNAQVSASP